MAFWFKADAGVYSDAGTTPATNGQTVEQWNDQSGRGNNAAQAISGARPVYAAGVLCGLPGILFNGASDTLPITNPAVCAQYFVVGMSGTITWNNYGGFIESQNDGTYPRLGTMRPSTTAFHDAAPPSAVAQGRCGPVGRLFRPRHRRRIRHGADHASDAADGDSNSPTSSRKMALGSLDLSDFLSCCIFEIIGFASVLSAVDRNLVELYLQNKWERRGCRGTNEQRNQHHDRRWPDALSDDRATIHRPVLERLGLRAVCRRPLAQLRPVVDQDRSVSQCAGQLLTRFPGRNRYGRFVSGERLHSMRQRRRSPTARRSGPLRSTGPALPNHPPDRTMPPATDRSPLPPIRSVRRPLCPRFHRRAVYPRRHRHRLSGVGLQPDSPAARSRRRDEHAATTAVGSGR